MISTSVPVTGRAGHPGRYDHSPRVVVYEITQACDLACRFCRACTPSQAHPAELTCAESRTLVGQLAEFPTRPSLVLTGGDPLQRSDLVELVCHARDSGLEVALAAAATPRVTREALRRLRNAGISRLALGIDGADARTHDRVRGIGGSYQRSLEIIEDARDLGIPLQINTQMTALNVYQIDRLAEWLAGQSILLWSVVFPVPVGRAGDAPRLTAEQCEQAFARLWAHALHQPFRIKTAAAPHFRRFVAQHRHWAYLAAPLLVTGRPLRVIAGGVSDGKGQLFVSHTGWIYPSGWMPIVCGLFPWEHVVHVYQRSPLLQQLRDSERLEGKCGRCEFRRLCGGSRARAWALTGNPFAPEPDCAYLPAGSD